jgi:hypothetical protein
MALWLLVTAGDGLGGGAAGVEAVSGVNRIIGSLKMGLMVVLGVAGCLVAGLLYGLFSLWGRFSHGWTGIRSGRAIRPGQGCIGLVGSSLGGQRPR